MNIFTTYKHKIFAVVSTFATDNGWHMESIKTVFDTVSVEPPRDTSHGDISTNVAMVLCKKVRTNPRTLAQMIADVLVSDTDIKTVDIAGPGFINLTLNHTVWQSLLSDIIAMGNTYGNSDFGAQQAVNIEFVSANPTGPLHIGHTRGAVYGDVLSSIMNKVGFKVTREYYINDAGGQIDILARSAFLRYRQACGERVTLGEGLYPGKYLIPVGEKIKQQYGESLLHTDESEWLGDIGSLAVESMMDLIRADLESLQIKHDVFTSEKSLIDSNCVEQAIDSLNTQGHIYQGVLAPPKGKQTDDWESRPQTLFKSSKFGDDVDRALKKSDGSYTYFASDIANHYDKFTRGFTRQIDVMGADHGGYVKRMCGAVTAVTGGKASLEIHLCQLVKLLEKGSVVKMSKRAGNFVTLRDLVDAVGSDVIRFFMMMRKADAHMDFDLQAVQEKSQDNPIFYIQYAHARCHSVLKSAKKLGYDVSKGDVTHINDPAFIELVKHLALYPRILEQSAISREPHRLAFYTLDVASAFHALWAKGSGTETLRFIQPDKPIATSANLVLVLAVQQIIANALQLFAIEAKDVL